MLRESSLAAVLALMTVAPLAAGAQPGIDFAAMPAGCNWVTEYSNGSVWRETFQGWKNGHYVTRTTEAARPNKLVKTTEFNRDGWMTRRVWANSKWESFAPYSCFGEAGRCAYHFRTSDGAHMVVENETEKRGDRYLVRGRVRGKADAFPDEVVELGSFRLMVSNSSAAYSARITELRDCGLAGS